MVFNSLTVQALRREAIVLTCFPQRAPLSAEMMSLALRNIFGVFQGNLWRFLAVSSGRL